jgi:hypothetical protein
LASEERTAIQRALSHLDDPTMDDVVTAAGYRLGSLSCQHGGKNQGPALTLEPQIQADLVKFDQILEKDAIAPKTLGITPGMRPDLKAAAVTKRRTKIQSFAASMASQTMGAGLHTSLESVGVNILRVLHGAVVSYGPTTDVMKLRAERFLDGMMAEQVPQNWSSTGGWRTHSRYPVEFQTARGPWAGTQDKAAALVWGQACTMGSQGDAVPVFFTGEARDDALITEGNSEIPAIVTQVRRDQVQLPSIDGLLREAAEDDEGNPVAVRTPAEAVRVRQAAADAAKAEASEEVINTTFRPLQDGFQMQAGGVGAVVVTRVEEMGTGSVGLVTLTTEIVWRVRGVAISADRGNVYCPELELFSDAKRAEIEAGVNNGDIPDILMFAAQLVLRLNELATLGPEGSTFLTVPETASAVVWRHFCHQMRGTGAEAAALVSFSSLLLVRPETAEMRSPANDSDLRWLGRVLPGGRDTSDTRKELVSATSGYNAFGFHSARTRVFLGTCSPLTLYYAENQALVSHDSISLHYERNSIAGIKRACAKIAVVRTMFVDRSAAAAGVNSNAYLCGVGFPAVQGRGGSFGPAVLEEQVRSMEDLMSREFNNKFSVAWSVSVDLSRPQTDSVLGSRLWTLTRSVIVCGDSPERIPPYVWSTMVGDSLEYLSPTAPPDLSGSSPVEPDLDGTRLLVHGHVVSFPGASLSRPFYATRAGLGIEDAANPPYSVLSTNGARIGPRLPQGDVPLVGSHWASLFDQAFRNIGANGAVAQFSRTMGTIPYLTLMRNTPLTTLIDVPLRRSAHGAHCLTNVCTPTPVRASAARALPLPTAATSVAASSIFR